MYVVYSLFSAKNQHLYIYIYLYDILVLSVIVNICINQISFGLPYAAYWYKKQH